MKITISNPFAKPLKRLIYLFFFLIGYCLITPAPNKELGVIRVSPSTFHKSLSNLSLQSPDFLQNIHRNHSHRKKPWSSRSFKKMELIMASKKRSKGPILSAQKMEILKKDALSRLPQEIIREMKGYDLTELKDLKFPNKIIQLDDLIMEKGGEPIRSLIVASWRTGSTFTGALLDSHPAVFYEFEPLQNIGQEHEMDQIHSGGILAIRATEVLNGVLSCNHTQIPRVDLFQQKIRGRSSFSRRLYPLCKEWSCQDAEFRSNICRLFPFQVVKTVRMRLRLGSTLLENERFKRNLRILLLVRDPRGIMNSRMHRDWCTSPNVPDCSDPERLCKYMEEDYEEARVLREKYPENFSTIRYEDLSRHPFEAAQKIFKFFRLQFHPHVAEFINQSTRRKDNKYRFRRGVRDDVIRDTKKMVFHWMGDLYRKDQLISVMKIQKSCEKVMQMWGYVPVINVSQLSSGSFTPVVDPPWPEMIV